MFMLENRFSQATGPSMGYLFFLILDKIVLLTNRQFSTVVKTLVFGVSQLLKDTYQLRNPWVKSQMTSLSFLIDKMAMRLTSQSYEN